MTVKMRAIAIAAAVLSGLAASQDLVAASCAGTVITYTTAGQFGNVISGADLLQLSGEPFELTVPACSTMKPIKTGTDDAVYYPLVMVGTVQSGILGFPTKIRAKATLELIDGSSNAIELTAPVEIEPGVTVNIQGTLALPAGTLNSTSIAAFPKVTVNSSESTLTYSASGNSTTLAVDGYVEAIAKKKGGANASPRLLTDAGQVITAHADGTQTVRPMHAGPVDAGAAPDKVLLQFYAFGVRDASEVHVQIAGRDVPVRYFGAAGHFAGLDEVTVEIPHSLAGSGDVDVVLTADGQTASPVRIHIQ